MDKDLLLLYAKLDNVNKLIYSVLKRLEMHLGFQKNGAPVQEKQAEQKPEPAQDMTPEEARKAGLMVCVREELSKTKQGRAVRDFVNCVQARGERIGIGHVRYCDVLAALPDTDWTTSAHKQPRTMKRREKKMRR